MCRVMLTTHLIGSIPRHADNYSLLLQVVQVKATSIMALESKTSLDSGRFRNIVFCSSGGCRRVIVSQEYENYQWLFSNKEPGLWQNQLTASAILKNSLLGQLHGSDRTVGTAGEYHLRPNRQQVVRVSLVSSSIVALCTEDDITV